MPSLAFLFRNDTWQSGRCSSGSSGQRKLTRFLKQQREREKDEESEQERGGEEGTMGSGKGQETDKD